MYDSGKIIVGLIIFVGLFTSPIWYNVSGGKALNTPNVVLPSKENQKVCVADSAYMCCNHMAMLNDWRTRVVREGQTIFVSSTGVKCSMSLTKDCLNCHSNSAQFCDQCHNYIGMTPYCWDCHTEKLPTELGLVPQKPESKQ